jgi:hypothetical protein
LELWVATSEEEQHRALRKLPYDLFPWRLAAQFFPIFLKLPAREEEQNCDRRAGACQRAAVELSY